MADWRNWSGSVQASPQTVASPRDEDELARIVSAHDSVRVTGAGHSFMPLCKTNGALLRLDAMAGDIAVAADRMSAWVPAGWSLAKLTEGLWQKGLSLPNQGDVNPQSLAGAISTGTHGTGRELGSLSTMARGFRIMLADGSILECDAENNAETFEAARLSLGLLGIVLAIDIDLIPAYHLVETIQPMPFAQVKERWDELAIAHRHLEFWHFSYDDRVILKTLDLCDECPAPDSTSDTDEKAFDLYCRSAHRLPRTVPVLQRQIMKRIKKEERRGPAYAIFPSDRSTRFEEMEYEFSGNAGMDALEEVTAWIRAKKLPIAFPFEYRTVAGDDIWLSPFNRGGGTSVSMHQYYRMPWRETFPQAEAIFREHGGRPHWAKRHTLGHEDVTALYPRADDFQRVCRDLDPTGKFVNDAIAELFALERTAT